ncbi:hypothetical protein ACFRCX_33620 [Streptomyces sp. NPDC056652]|uniref:hypothetical protein n=1 Tax=Streptomyces sp. NPDC056652 TaxID=3345893 RepID=UPI003677E201
MSLIRLADPDFRVCEISFETLLAIQAEAEVKGWATRWSSVDALRSQVREGAVVLRPLMREERGGVVQAYRCLLLFAMTGDHNAGGIATIDIDPARLESLERIDRDPVVRRTLARMFSLASGGISMISKE